MEIYVNFFISTFSHSYGFNQDFIIYIDYNRSLSQLQTLSTDDGTN